MNRQQYLDFLRERSKLLQGATAEKVGTVLKTMREGMTPENEKRLFDLIKAAQVAGQGSAEALQLAAARIETVNNFLWASSNALQFFTEVDLATGDTPWIENTTNHVIQVDYIGQDGRPKKTQTVAENEQADVQLHTLSTQELEYYVMDIYRGDVRTPQLSNVDMAFDLMMKTDRILWGHVDTRILPVGQTFNYTNTRKVLRHFNPHSSIKIANLPTTNRLVPAGNTTATKWRKACMDLVLNYIASWGTNAFKDGPLMPMTVILPAKHLMGFLDEITSFTEAQPNSKVEEIMQTGFIVTYGGVRWNFIGDSTLDPLKGLAYVRMNKPIGTFFTKKSHDKVLVDNSIAMQKENKESVLMTKVIGAGLPSQYMVNIVGVQYKTDETL